MPIPLAVARFLPYWKHLAVVGLVAGIFGAGYQSAAWKYKHIIAKRDLKTLELRLEHEAAVKLIDQLNQDITQQIAQIAELERRKNRVVERVVTEEVIKYVETENATECGLSLGGVRVHDAAARGELPGIPDTPGEPDDGAIKVTNAQVIRVVTDNYATCNDTRDQLLLLQQWVRSIGTNAQ